MKDINWPLLLLIIGLGAICIISAAHNGGGVYIK